MKKTQTSIVKPTGSLTAMNSADFQAELTQLLKQPHTDFLLVDMEDVDFMDSAGLMGLVKSLQLAMSLRKKLSLLALSPSVKIIFEVSQLDKSFAIFRDIESYQASFNAPLSLKDYLVA